MRIFFTFSIFIFLLIGFVIYQLQKKPVRSAEDCAEKMQILFIGDSLVRGTIGFDFVSELRERSRKVLLNGGVNGDRVESLLERLPALMKCDPAKIIVLVGTNDVILSDDLDSFRRHYAEVIRVLKSGTRAQIAVASLPLFAGGLESDLNQKIGRYSRVIEGLAQQYSVDYLPVYERLARWMTSQPEPDSMTLTLPLPFIRRPFLVGFRRFIFQQSLTTISRAMGSELTVDGIHLNPTCGQIVADIIAPWIETP